MMNFLFDWSTLGMAEKIFTVIGSMALVLILLQSLMSLIAGDVDHDYDISDMDGHGGHSWGLLSVRGLFGYMLGLGWGGIIALRYGFGVFAATVLGSVVGVLIGLLLGLLMRMMHSLRSDGTIKLDNAIGQTGTVYQRIPAGRNGIGKVQVVVQGRLQTLEACTDAAADLAPQRHVKVVQVVSGNTLLVE
ncbi:MAG: hypothetical protein ACAI34_06175 [Verrucomicrobium sp.]